MRGRNYRRALERLERLVVQRLLELTKLNMSGVGYKQREKITQALRARAKAIQKALDEYNEAALTMEPPRPQLEWKDVLDMVSLADFDLLKDTHLDLTHIPWAQPHHRECTRIYFGLTRAREEITRLNVEIHRLISFMIDEHADHYHACHQLEQEGGDKLAEEIRERMRVMGEVDGHIAIRLVQTSELEGFSGTLLPGRRRDRDPSITDTAPLPAWATVVLGLSRTDDQGTYTTSATSSRSFSDILPANEGERLDPEGLLDYFEGLGLHGSKNSIDNLVSDSGSFHPFLWLNTLSLMNNQTPWHECLRLQGKREEQWLKLRGYAPDEIPQLVEERRQFREYTIERYSGRLIERCQHRDRMFRLIRSYSRDLDTSSQYGRRKLNQLRGKAYCEAQHVDAELEIARLGDMIERLKPPPRLVLRRRKKVQASAEVEVFVSRMADMVSRTGGS
ncbi:hypothetical protein PQX77_009486 [Marasmius sp. AFHP31]|nr:hypothetical protein PQX77_009486 [Marasmius sp. AFHP31]